MKQSQLFPKTKKEAPKDAISINHKLLVRAGFIDQLMAGSYSLLPMGFKVVNKINNIIREELNKIGCQEILMPLLHPKEIWNETGRWDSAKEVMYQFKDKNDKEFALSFTHEEIFLDLVRKHVLSYKDLPIAMYHFSTKFRNELRAKSGILRGREFMMKDLYSIHEDENDFNKFYDEVKNAYSKIFKRLGFDFKITQAGGGVFTDNFTHEFQVPTEGGEDLIYYCEKCDWAVNKEVFDPDTVTKPESEKSKVECPVCHGKVVSAKSIEVGNIFPFGTYYSKKMNVSVADKKGNKNYLYFGSYGIGSTRVMGTWVEVSNDEKGIIWSKEISPFDVHLIDLTENKGQKIYDELTKNNIDVLWDERDISAGQKFADCDLIGIPIRLVISEKNKGMVEVKERKLDKVEIMTIDEVNKRLGGDF